MLPLRDTLLSMNDALALMDDTILRLELGSDISDAVSALAIFSNRIFTTALMRNLCSEDIACVNSDSYSRLSSRAASPQGASARAINPAALLVCATAPALRLCWEAWLVRQLMLLCCNQQFVVYMLLKALDQHA